MMDRKKKILKVSLKKLMVKNYYLGIKSSIEDGKMVMEIVEKQQNN